MSISTEPIFSVAEVSARTGLSGHTLRFYEQEGLLGGAVARNASGHRAYSEEQIAWLQVCTKLRASGMSLPDIRRYAELFTDGPQTVPDRLGLLRGHAAKVRDQIAELESALSVIENKITLYERRMEAGTADELWREGPECQG